MAGFAFTKKLKQLKIKVSHWRKEEFGSIKIRKQSCLQKLGVLDQKALSKSLHLIIMIRLRFYMIIIIYYEWRKSLGVRNLGLVELRQGTKILNLFIDRNNETFSKLNYHD